MSDYIYEPDGKIHTRYSELIRCTPGQIARVVQERLDPSKRYRSHEMLFGESAHEIYEEESRETGRTPKVFDNVLGESWPLSHVEFELATEMLPNVIIHSRIDSVALERQTVIDYKTVKDGVNGWQKNILQYKSSRQLPFYACQLGFHNMRVRKGLYLCEIYNEKQTEVIDYRAIHKDLKMSEIAKVLPFIKDRVAMLVANVEAVAAEQGVA